MIRGTLYTQVTIPVIWVNFEPVYNVNVQVSYNRPKGGKSRSFISVASRMMGNHPETDLAIRSVDRELWLWTLLAGAHNAPYGSAPWQDVVDHFNLPTETKRELVIEHLGGHVPYIIVKGDSQAWRMGHSAWTGLGELTKSPERMLQPNLVEGKSMPVFKIKAQPKVVEPEVIPPLLNTLLSVMSFNVYNRRSITAQVRLCGSCSRQLERTTPEGDVYANSGFQLNIGLARLYGSYEKKGAGPDHSVCLACGRDTQIQVYYITLEALVGREVEPRFKVGDRVVCGGVPCVITSDNGASPSKREYTVVNEFDQKRVVQGWQLVLQEQSEAVPSVVEG